MSLYVESLWPSGSCNHKIARPWFQYQDQVAHCVLKQNTSIYIAPVHSSPYEVKKKLVCNRV